MAETTFVYVTYIRTTPEALWEALTQPEFTRAYWGGVWHDCSWEPGASWELKFADGRVADKGEVVEIRKPERLVLRWRNEFMPEMKAEGDSTCVFELEPADEMVRLTITHSNQVAGSRFIGAVSAGWPMILSSLKSLLETGKPLSAPKNSPKSTAKHAASNA